MSSSAVDAMELSPRARAAAEDIVSQGVGEEVADWRENADAAGQQINGSDQRRMATSVIHKRLRQLAERDIANGLEPLAAADETAVVRTVLDDMFGAGMVDRLMENPMVENIDAVGCDRVWISYADGRKVRGPALWRTDQEMIEHLRRLGARAGQVERRFDNGAYSLRLQLPNGARLFAVMSVTSRPCLSVRQHRKADATLSDLRRTGMFDDRVEEFLSAAVHAGLNILVSGGTNAGKTTLLRAMLGEVDPDERIITIEANRELNLEATGRHDDLVSMEARDANTEGEGAVTLAELVRLSLSMNPDRVIVGEVLGEEIVPMLNAMSQGNDGSMCTIHAASSDGVLDRVAAYCIQAPERLDRVAANLLLVNAIDLVVHIHKRAAANKRVASDGISRRVASIREIVAAEHESVTSNELFRPGPDGAEPTGVPLRPSTAERLADVGYSTARAFWAVP